MAKKKLQHFAENRSFAHYFECPYPQLISTPHPNKGHWNQLVFHRQGKLVVEIGCGKGEYTIGLARRYPENNHIGVDIKGARIWRGARTVQDDQLNNAAFIRSQAGLLPFWFGEAEVDEIWITFPDPQPGSRANKRLTSPRYLNMFRKFLKPGGLIHLKTDSQELFEYTLGIISHNGFHVESRTDDIYGSGCKGPLSEIRTFYENIWLDMGKIISHVAFSINHPAYDKDTK